MKEQKRLGRGLGEISHLFITSRNERTGIFRGPTYPALLARSPRCISVKSLIPFPANAFLISLAHVLAARQVKVLMVDFQEPGPDLGSLLGLQKLAPAVQEYIRYGDCPFWVSCSPRIKVLGFQLNPKDFEGLPSHERDIFQHALVQEEFQAECLLADIPFSKPGPGCLYACLVHEVLLLCPPRKKFVPEIYLEVKDLLKSNDQLDIGLLFLDHQGHSEAPESFQLVLDAVQKFLGASISYEGILPPLHEALDLLPGDMMISRTASPGNRFPEGMAQLGDRIGKRKTNNPYHIPTPFFEKVFSLKP